MPGRDPTKNILDDLIAKCKDLQLQINRLRPNIQLGNVQQETVADAGTTNPFSSGVNGDLLWGHSLGDTLFDYTNSAKPLILEDGVYAAAMIVFCSHFTSGHWTLDVRFGEASTAPIMFFDSVDVGPDPGGSGGFARVIMPAWLLPAGAECNVHVTNNTGGSRTFLLETSYIQRIS